MRKEILCSIEGILDSLYGGEIHFNLTESDNLKEVGVDSLSFIQLIIAIEKKYDFRFSTETLSQDEIKKLSILIDNIEGCCAKTI